MTRFLLGAATVGACWALVEWFKNPMGHRGGDVPLLCGEPEIIFTNDGEMVEFVSCERPFGHDGSHNSSVPGNVEALGGHRGFRTPLAPDIPRPRFLP